MKQLMILYVNMEPTLISCSVNAIWNEIGQHWGIYEVRYADTNEIVNEFIPY